MTRVLLVAAAVFVAVAVGLAIVAAVQTDNMHDNYQRWQACREAADKRFPPGPQHLDAYLACDKLP